MRSYQLGARIHISPNARAAVGAAHWNAAGVVMNDRLRWGCGGGVFLSREDSSLHKSGRRSGRH